MGILSSEVRNIQNPALGAGLIWRFVCGYVAEHASSNPVPLPLIFLVLPTILHQQTESFIQGTQKSSGLRAFAAKFGAPKNCKQDLLLTINIRMLTLKNLSLESLRIALATRLIHLETDATVIPLSKTKAIAGIPNDIRTMMNNAEKLGAWCAPLTVHEIATTLKVRF
jgi:hypothetical protein